MEVLRGPDVSQYQGGAIDWHAVKNAGASFAGTKCSEGIGYLDATFQSHWQGMAAVQLTRIAYHFARPDLDNAASGEADWFLHCLGPLQVGDIIALDIESVANVDVAAWCVEWLRHVEQAVGFPPLVYTYLAYAEARLQDSRLTHNPLWLALYDQPCPKSVPPWTEVAVHQHSSTATYPGIPGPCDESVVARSLDQLRALGKPAAAAPPHPTPAPTPHPQPHKVVITKTMMLRKDPHHDDIFDPAQLVYRGATLDVVGPEADGWLLVEAGHRRGYVLAANTHPA